MEHQVKSQNIRLLDVVFIGPVMIFAAMRLPKKDTGLAWILAGLGVSTIAYNARNYLRVAELVPPPSGESSTLPRVT
jgi:hypothetical protein